MKMGIFSQADTLFCIKQMIKEIIGYVNLYKISSNGEIFSCKKLYGMGIRKEKKLKNKIDRCGYVQALLLKNCTDRKYFLVHRLVYENFIGKIPKGLQINHMDGDKTNNNINNLELVSASENMKHAFRIGLKSIRGEKHPSCKLSNHIVNKIRKEMGSQRQIAKKFGISQSMVSKIKKRLSWSHI